ncbi:MAG: dTMP kinase [Candidatus Woesearchaeota archaeon]|nr:MAG: dTMP kinase [Candidatus Woesearchaeota archaeon]
MTSFGFITFEGGEGSGKSTQVQGLKQVIESAYGSPVFSLREPGGEPISERIRVILLDPQSQNMTAETEVLLFLAARAQLAANVTKPVLQGTHRSSRKGEGATVISDRYHDSTVAYQLCARFGGNSTINEAVEVIYRNLVNLHPDLTLLFDLPVEVGLARAGRRNVETGIGETEGRFDQLAVDFHNRVRDAYLDIAASEPERVKVIDASQSIEAVAMQVRETFAAYAQKVLSGEYIPHFVRKP